MAEFDFYFNDSQRIELAEYIFSNKGIMIPDIHYKTDKYIEIKDVKDFLKYLLVCPHYFLIDKTYTNKPLLFRQIMKNDERLYYINQRWAGPYIDLLFFRDISQDAPFPCARSNISYYKRFISPSDRLELSVPKSLKEYYDDIVTHIKSASKLMKRNGKRYWIGEQTLMEISSNLS